MLSSVAFVLPIADDDFRSILDCMEVLAVYLRAMLDLRRSGQPSFLAVLTVRIRRLLILVIGITGLAVSSANGQSHPLLTPPFDRIPLTAAAPTVIPSAAITERFWVVSSRNCDDSMRPGGPCCSPDYLQCDGSNHLQCISAECLRTSLIPGIPICLQVHGSFVDFNGSYEDARNTVRWLRAAAGDQPFQMVFFAWPSDRHISVFPQIDVGILGRRASRTGFFIADLINLFPPECPVCLIGHSHGARATSSALHLLGGGSVEGAFYRRPVVPRRMRAIMVSAAIDHHWLNPGERFGRALWTTESLLNIRNKRDCALAVYTLRRPFGNRALGLSGFTNRDRRKLGSRVHRIREIDVSQQLRHGHIWPRFYERREMACLFLPHMLYR